MSALAIDAGAQTPCVVATKAEPAILSWQRNATNNDGALIERSVNGAPFTAIFLSSDATEVTFQDGSLAQDGRTDNRYEYRVANIRRDPSIPNGYLQSGYSNTGCKIIKAAVLADPSKLIIALERLTERAEAMVAVASEVVAALGHLAAGLRP